MATMTMVLQCWQQGDNNSQCLGNAIQWNSNDAIKQ